MQLVWISLPGGGFSATVDLSIESLDLNAPPACLEGSFLAYGMNPENEEIVHATRANDATDPVIYFSSDFRHGYRFKMQSDSSSHFSAELLDAPPQAADAEHKRIGSSVSGNSGV